MNTLIILNFNQSLKLSKKDQSYQRKDQNFEQRCHVSCNPQTTLGGSLGLWLPALNFDRKFSEFTILFVIFFFDFLNFIEAGFPRNI